ncbi:MAG: RagB/SusD family nutrient uptake outer membrane protein [Tannerella sp.]|jgi:hypothetical protein|nr:RagB/SusD family nutrient uptake outer membrane protein [Tannerella sp.]
MKSLNYLFVILGFAILSLSCEDYLDVQPKGTIGEEMLNTPEMVEKMIIAAYAHVEHDYEVQAAWWFSDLRSGDMYKGGGGVSDQAWGHDIEVSSTIQVTRAEFNTKWVRHYVAISRANNALARINNLTEAEYPDKIKRAAEMRFLRAFQYIQLKQIFNRVVWVDETMDEAQLLEESNVKYTSQELWDLIIADFRYAADNLPEDNLDVGRANKFSATSFLVKALMFAAYEQNEDYSVNNVNMDKMREVVSLVSWIQSRNRFILNDDFAKNFLYEFGTKGSTEVSESVFAVQSSINDGTPFGKLNMFSMLSYIVTPEYGCCGFRQPSQNLVNAYKTDPATGLPLFDNFNDNNAPQFQQGSDIDAHPEITVDPRLMHTVAFVDRPYKYDLTYLLPTSGIRDPQLYGYTMSLKEIETYNCTCYTAATFFRSSSLKRDLIRYAEVLLWKAEALIQLGELEEARLIINQLRTRAKNSTSRLIMPDGTPSAHFKIEEYPAAGWTRDYAWRALQWEVRLEMALEGKHGFDLTRWGVLGDVLNKYYEVEKIRRAQYMSNALFTKGKHEYFPIPNNQITYSKGLYKQNPGYDQ